MSVGFTIKEPSIFMPTGNFLFIREGIRSWIFTSLFCSWNGFAFKIFLFLSCWSPFILRRSKADVESRSFFDVEILNLLKAEVRVEVDVKHWSSSFILAIPNLLKTEDQVVEGLIWLKIEMLGFLWIVNFFNGYVIAIGNFWAFYKWWLTLPVSRWRKIAQD